MPGDILTRPAPPPDAVLNYGPGQDHVADLRLPAGERLGGDRVPLVIFWHGGFWRAAYDRTHTGPLAAALAAAGAAVCTPEFRKVGQPGGGWPGIFDDVAAAADSLPGLVASQLGPADGQTADAGAVGDGKDSRLGRVVFAGHSAGGHLALWAAGRHRLPAATAWRTTGPGCDGVVALAAVSDLVSGFQRRLGNGAVADLLGGGPARHAERYALTDPAVLLPTGVPAILLHGRDDDVVPCELSAQHAARARAVGDDVAFLPMTAAGHYEVIDPLSGAWDDVLAAFLMMCTLDGPAEPAPGAAS